MKSFKLITAIITLIIVAVIKSFFLTELNHYESSCLFMLMYLCVQLLLQLVLRKQQELASSKAFVRKIV